LLLHAIVHPAQYLESPTAASCCCDPVGSHPLLKKLFAGRGLIRRPKFQNRLTKILPRLEAEIVKAFRSWGQGFAVLPKRWIVERTIAWLNRCRRLAKDWENLNRKALAFLRLASSDSNMERRSASMQRCDIPRLWKKFSASSKFRTGPRRWWSAPITLRGVSRLDQFSNAFR